MGFIYKIIANTDWNQAVFKGVFQGAAIDLSDGFIHLSTASQAEETARRHFAGQDHLLLVAFNPLDLGALLKWEPSRGGELFPHVYGHIDPKLAVWAKPLVLKDSVHQFPEGWAA
jgi:uncharacterized protein (DUF952 family)